MFDGMVRGNINVYRSIGREARSELQEDGEYEGNEPYERGEQDRADEEDSDPAPSRPRERWDC